MTRLKALDLKHNPKLVEIPDTVLNLPENCTIDISREGASEARLQHLQETSATEGYRGPSFRIQ
ncbi:MAG: hypothetical protein S4CHLAM123_12550 [Chlamydiales bacterium]|nr:hypothetical protein [Chlamydiales bacterium]